MSWIFKKSIAFENIYSLVFFWLLVLIADTFADIEYVYMLSAINISACQNHRATGTVHRRTHEKHTHTHTREKNDTKWHMVLVLMNMNMNMNINT